MVNSTEGEPVRPAEVPEVFWLPEALTPGKVIGALPLNDTPPMSLAVSSIVAVAALPLQDPDEPDVLPVTLPVKAPINVVAVTIPAIDAAAPTMLV